METKKDFCPLIKDDCVKKPCMWYSSGGTMIGCAIWILSDSLQDVSSALYRISGQSEDDD